MQGFSSPNSNDCKEHHQLLTNFCQQCQRLICPLCVEQHSQRQLKHRLYAIGTALSKAGTKLLSIRTHIQKRQMPSELTSSATKVLLQLQALKQLSLRRVNAYFEEQSQKVKGLLQIDRQSTTFHEEQQRANAVLLELLQLEQSLRNADTVAEGLSKIFRIDQQALIGHVLGRGREHGQQRLFLVAERESLANKWEIFLPTLFRIEVQDLSNSIREHSVVSQPTKQQSQRPMPMPLQSQQMQSPKLINTKKQDNQFFKNRNMTAATVDLCFMDDLDSTLHIFQGMQWKSHKIQPGRVPRFARLISLGHGRVLFTGGVLSQPQKRSSEILIWNGKQLQVSGQLMVPRSSHAVIKSLLPNNLIEKQANQKVFLLGGHVSGGSTTDKAEIIQLKSVSSALMIAVQSTTLIKKMLTACANAATCWLDKDNLIRAGGRGHDGYNCNSIQIYNLNKNQWTMLDPSVDAADDFSLVSGSGMLKLDSNRFIIFGGFNQEQHQSLPRAQVYSLRRVVIQEEEGQQQQWILGLQQGGLMRLPEAGVPLCAQPCWISDSSFSSSSGGSGSQEKAGRGRFVFAMRNAARNVKLMGFDGAKWSIIQS